MNPRVPSLSFADVSQAAQFYSHLLQFASATLKPDKNFALQQHFKEIYKYTGLNCYHNKSHGDENATCAV